MKLKKILLLGSGELGREFVISAKRLGCYVVACDNYAKAPAMQVADEHEVFDMLDGDQLRSTVLKHQPDFVVPEIEAIRTEVLIDLEQQGYLIIPSARAVNLTMNRDHIRNRAKELGLSTARFGYAQTLNELKKVAEEVRFPMVVKPVMSSSGKGQSYVHQMEDLEASWNYACENMRGDRQKVIAEEFINFDYEITVLTIRQKSGETLFCEPIGHVQERGDYQYSWQPLEMREDLLESAKRMAKVITDDLGGFGLFGVEFFIYRGFVLFSELSPRPHDTGMVTMISQNLSEFDLHARAILGYPIPRIECTNGASAVILADSYGVDPEYHGIDQALKDPWVDVRIFSKPSTRPYRRMGVALANGDRPLSSAREAAAKIIVTSKEQ